jgi:hypothetical protein
MLTYTPHMLVKCSVYQHQLLVDRAECLSVEFVAACNDAEVAASYRKARKSDSNSVLF